MNQKPHIIITREIWNNASCTLGGGHKSYEICNKAIEIALAEQANEQYITAEEARKLGAEMRASTELRLAERSRCAMERHLKQINNALPDLGDGNQCSILYQYGDGWVISYGNRSNARVKAEELDQLTKLSPEAAFQFLEFLQRKEI